MRLRIVESRLNQKIEQFCRDESGGMLIFMVIAFFTMTIFGGLAVDLSNHEQRRTTYQTHLDNAVLAAASLSQQLDPEEVVFSYMSSAGLDPSVVNVETSEENIGSILVGRTVYASLDGGVNTYFFRFFDIDSLIHRYIDVVFILAIRLNSHLDDTIAILPTNRWRNTQKP